MSDNDYQINEYQLSFTLEDIVLLKKAFQMSLTKFDSIDVLRSVEIIDELKSIVLRDLRRRNRLWREFRVDYTKEL